MLSFCVFKPNKSYIFSTLQLCLQRVIVHFAFRCFTILIITADVIIVVIDVINYGDEQALEILSLIIITYFLFEVFIRIFAKG